ncbi:MAG: PD-(D/E)XK nuclease family protein, partial [Chloroflexi bacterium]|nr:PD-(D/E)XK nuclease family protein [Chloroflexota bacterium]
MPNYYAGRQIRWGLAADDGYVNVRTLLIGDLAEQVLGVRLSGLSPLTPVVEQSAVRVAARLTGGVLEPVAHHPALHESLLHLFREMRRSEARLEQPHSPMARAATAAFDVFKNLIEPYVDRTSLRRLAADVLTRAPAIPPILGQLGALVVVLPSRLDPADVALLAAAARWLPIRTLIASFTDDDLANTLPALAATDLWKALGLDSVGPAPRPSAEPPLGVIRAPDPAEEIREVTRAVARDLAADPPVPLHRMAVLYRQADPYAALVRETFTLSGLPWSALEGRTLAESAPGRALLTLLELRQRNFLREAVLSWIDAAPRRQAGLRGAAWDRLTRAANIVRGAQQWLTRLDNYAARQRELAAEREQEDNTPAAEALRREATQAEAIRDEIATLRQVLRPPPDGASWDQFVTWAETLFATLCGGVRAWSADDAPFAEDIGRILAELRAADSLEGDSGTSAELFLVTVHDALESRARPVGSLGQGILVGPVQSVTGLAFDRVYIVGMTEGAFPTPAADDPFFPSTHEDPLHLRERQRQAERLAFRTAVAAADGGTLTLSVPDSVQGRKAFPSPWLLELASAPAGVTPLFTTQFQNLHETEHSSWLRVVGSTTNGIQRAPRLSDLEDRRLRESADADQLTFHAMAARSDLPLGAGLTVSGARASADFTPFDGNGEIALDTHRILQSVRRISASAIESWATCPFQFFLGRVLRVDATDRPEDGWSVDPLERGSLVHRILERFFKQLRGAGRFDGLDQYSSADYQLLEDIAQDCFGDLERRGVTGHPLVWESTRATIRADLRTFLARDERWRAERRLQPRLFEQPFGMRQTDAAWPALDVTIAGQSISFRGSIDRIDVVEDPTGRRAFLYDYKTGSTST